MILMQLRGIIIYRMSKPEECLIVIDDKGNPVKEIMKNTENVSLYRIMKGLIINLALLDWDNMR
jgi:hypothetical protein